MIIFKKKFYLFKLTDQWFRLNSSFRNLYSLSTFSYVQRIKPEYNSYCIKSYSHTIIINLKESYELIVSKFKNTVKQEIRKAQKEGIICCFKDDIDTFISFYNDFATLKNIYPINKSVIEQINKNIKTSYAYHNNKIIVAHSYIIDEEIGIARLYHSASVRLNQNFDKKTIGLANKYLTSNDIQYFKNSGFEKYDFGGYAKNTKNKSLQGINDFKNSFGGEIIKCLNYHSIPYFILKKITEMLDRRYK